MMTSWRDKFLKNLEERDKQERTSYTRLNDQYIEAYTRLLERTAALEVEKAATTIPSNSTSKDPAENEGNSQIRADLAETLRSNGVLKSRLKAAETELEKLRIRTKSDSKSIEELSRDRGVLAQKVKDRDDELKGKTKHFHDVQDEMISLNLQLNISEQKATKLAAENKELIDRWMARKGREADEMNKTLQD
ncbi:hypothetical protein B7494_g6577 [Chlorociboria aeruginascens]|nr:hypothetical protein B7494_g6577 [Chlorociboria aeruginascens]